MTTLNLRYYNQVADDYEESGAHNTAADYRALIAEVERLTEVVTDLTTERFINDQQALDNGPCDICGRPANRTVDHTTA